MDTAEEASDYDSMDHRGVNLAFCEDALAALGSGIQEKPLRVLDLGTGTALIPVQLCKLHAHAWILAKDLARHMLKVAEANVTRAGFSARIKLSFGNVKDETDEDGATFGLDAAAGATFGQHAAAAATFDLVMSNSVVHHMPEPIDLLRVALAKVAPTGTLFIRDLERPATEAALDGLVARYAAVDATLPQRTRERDERQRALFAASLRAALTLEEARELGAKLGIPGSAFQRTSDRHWTLAWTRS